MMTAESSTDSDLSLFEFLTRRARHSSDRRLAIDAAAGFAVAAAALLWRGPGWHVLLCVGFCFLFYGVWGIADRELSEIGGVTSSRRIWLATVRLAAAILGMTAAILFALFALGVAIGRVIS